MTVSVLFLAGRFLFAVPFVMVGVDRLLATGASAAERLWAAVGLLGAAGVVLGVFGDVAALVVAAAVVGAGITQRPGEEADSYRLVGLLGGAVCVAALYAAVGSALDLTITAPVLDLDLR